MRYFALYLISCYNIRMADREFSKEGLSTVKNRDAIANRIEASLHTIQGKLAQRPSQDLSLEEQYESLISDLQYQTIQAFEEGDQEWVRDCTAVIAFMTAQNAGIQQLLTDTVANAWERLKEDRVITKQAKEGDIAVRQENILTKFGRALFGKRK